MGSGQDERRSGKERGAVEDFVEERRGELVADRLHDREETVPGNEHVVGHQRVAPGAPHPGDVPCVLDREIGHRHQHQPLVQHLAGAVQDLDAPEPPLRVQASARVRPLSGYPEPAVYDLGPLGRGQCARDAVVRVLAPHVLLCLLRPQSGEVAAPVHEAHRPCGGSAPARQLPRHLELRAKVGLQPAEAPWLHEPEDPGLPHRVDALLRDPPFRLGPLGVGCEQRNKAACPLDERSPECPFVVGAAGAVEDVIHHAVSGIE